MKVTCPNCGKSLEYAIAKNFEGKVECLGCQTLLRVVVVRGELQETRIYGEPEASKPRGIFISDHDIEQSWIQWRVDGWVVLQDFKRLVKRTYSQLVERAKKGSKIFYSELDVYGELHARFGDGVSQAIGLVLGACSEAELRNRRPPISAIVVNKETRYPGEGFYGLTGTLQQINYDTWEGKGIRGQDIPMDIQVERLNFWEQKVKEVHAFWGSRENEY